MYNWQAGHAPQTSQYETEVEDGGNFFYCTNATTDIAASCVDYCTYAANPTQRECSLRTYQLHVGLGNVNTFSAPSGEFILE